MIRSAARSATAITGALVLPRGTVGITEASTTRSALEALDPQLGVDDRADRAGADRVVDREGVAGDVVAESPGRSRRSGP